MGSGKNERLEFLTNLLKDKDWNMRREAAFALEQEKDFRAFNPLVAALAHEEEGEGVYGHILVALTRFGESSIKGLLELQKHENEKISMSAKKALEIATLLWQAAAIEELQKSDDPGVREWASKTLEGF